MNENKLDKGDTQFAEYERIFRLLCEAVNESPSIKDYSEYHQSPAYFYRYWTINNEDDWQKSLTYRGNMGNNAFIDVYKYEDSRDVILLIQHSQTKFASWLEIPLFSVARLLFLTAKIEINKPELKRIFDLNSDQEKEEAIDNAVKAVLKRLFWALPRLILQATDRAIHDSILSYIKTDLERVYSLHWKKMELSRNHEYLPHDILNWLNGQIKAVEDWRQRFIGNIREIPEPELSELPQRYKELSAAYKIAKKEHGQKKEKYLAAENRRTLRDWREQWKKEFVYYPELYPDCLMLLCDEEIIKPHDIAFQHLSFDWGYSPDHIRRIIKEQKAIAKGQGKKSGSSK